MKVLVHYNLLPVVKQKLMEQGSKKFFIIPFQFRISYVLTYISKTIILKIVEIKRVLQSLAISIMNQTLSYDTVLLANKV